MSGLTNGQAYTFTVTASNSAGSTTSAPTAPVTPQADTTPPRMSEVTVTPDRVSLFGGTVTVTMRVTDEGSGLQGSPNFTFSGGGGGLGSMTRISGDKYDGVYRGTYTFAALSALGTRTLSVYPLRDEAGNSTFFVDGPSVVVGAPGTPAAPTATVRDDRRVALGWVAPDQDGNVIDSYEVELVPTGEVFTTTSTSYVHALGNRPASQPVSYRVRAHNAGGWSRWSPATPSLVVPALAPDTVTGVQATRGDRQATVSWAAPDDNGSPITGYTVSVRAGGQEVRTVTAAAGQRSATVTGLVNGTSYTFTVAASNTVGSSAASLPSAPVVPAGVPAAPAAPSVGRGDAAVTVTWVAPDDNGSPITGYTVSVRAGGQEVRTVTAAAGQRSATVTGLVNGTSYTFTVAASNTVGSSAASLPSAPVVPAGVPAAPAAPSVGRGDAAVTVSWAAPDDNGSPITGYTVSVRAGGQEVRTVTAAAGQRSATVTGLVNGTSYTFTVAASNTVGSSAASLPSAPVVPAGVPAAPAAPSVVRGDAAVTVTWVAPDDNGSPITGYTVSVRAGGQEVRTVTAAAGQRSATVTGLVNGTSYTFVVSAVNAVGSSAASLPSVPVVPAGVPDAPAAPSVVGGDAAVTVSWAEVPGNGDPVTGYVVRAYAGGAVKKVVEVGAGVTSTTVTGLVNGTSHTFTVTAVNGVGASPESAASAAVTPVAPPKPGPKAKAPSQMAPPKVTVRGKNAVLRWKAAKANGAKVTSYLIDIAPNKRVKDRVVKGSARQITLKKLRPGTYRVRIAGSQRCRHVEVQPLGEDPHPLTCSSGPEGPSRRKFAWSALLRRRNRSNFRRGGSRLAAC
ncbi:fibronectin type III domain-containing protein [Nocardioides daphniae]|uniref:fibronectin type III domain-containing protein n=1 Tax=Nocardioides daphniae TaxID=402297 RepID=UPI0013157C52|nr:fibronectin type III domain-containing protein [Nocardioides daphniae]